MSLLGEMVRRLVAAFRLALLFCAAAGFAFSGPAQAQQEQFPEGTIGWTALGADGAYGTAYEACEAQWKHYMANGNSRFLGAHQHDDNWTIADCNWTRYQYLCPEETGAGFACGTILPHVANFQCATGYTPTADGHCRLKPAAECKTCGSDGRANPVKGNPIVLSTGSKVITATDYSSADGQFVIGRQYRSFQVGRPIEERVLPRSSPRGLIGGWNFSHAYEIQLGGFTGSPSAPNARVVVLTPEGTGIGFVLQADGQWVPDPAMGAANTPKDVKLEFVGTLPAILANVHSGPSTWKFTDENDTVWTMETRAHPNSLYNVYKIAWPVQRAARGGYSQTYAYNADSSLQSITDSFGRTATFTWDQYYFTAISPTPADAFPYPLAVRSIALPDGSSLRYTYDPPPAATAPSKTMIKRLVKAEHLDAAGGLLSADTYLYEDPRLPTHVTGIVDMRGVRTRTYEYDQQGRSTLTKQADGAEAYQVAYGTAGTARTARSISPAGKASTYTFAAFDAAKADYRLTQIAAEASASTPAGNIVLGYGADTFYNSVTDPEGRATTIARDFRGRPTSIVEGSGASLRTTTITWHPGFNVPATLVRPGLTASYSYNALGQPVSASFVDTTTQTVPYQTSGQTRTFTYAWDTRGRLLSVNGPRPPDGQGHDDITSFAYDPQGNLLTQTDPLGHITTFGSYDANGRPGTVTDPNGAVTALTYDALGRVKTITENDPVNPAQNAMTTLGYDAVGQLTTLTLPSTESLLFDYDNAGRLITMRAANGERRDFVYDVAGNATVQTVKRADGSQSSAITSAFDDLGRVTGIVTGTGHSSKFAYDKVDNPVSATTPNKTVTARSFDALNRLVQVVAPDGGTSAFAYDAQDNPVSVTDPVAVTTQFTYNGFGEVIREVSPDRGTNTYWYDAAGDLVQSSDGRGQVIVYTRDTLGRVTSMTPQGRPASETVTYTWDGGGLAGSYQVGRLGRIDDGSGTTLFQYDHRGNLIARQQAIGASAAAQLGYSYDAADRITQIAYPSGRLVRYTYDSKGRVSQVDTKASAAISGWTPVAGNLSYEPFAAVKSMALGNGLAVTNDWGNDGRLASRRLTRSADQTSLSYLAYRYDGNDNITAIVDQLGPGGTLVYGYDKLDRLGFTLINSGSAAGTASYSYTPGTNRLASLSDAGGVRTIGYDGRGNTASELRPGAVTATSAYDGYARLTGYSRSDAGAYAFIYNGLDDRVMMALPSGTRRFVYDGGGRVMGEYGASAADVKAEYIWLSPEQGYASMFGGDGLGGYMPLAVASPDAGGTVQLSWVHANHLGVPLLLTDAAGAAITTAPDYLAPGFPGQTRVLPDLYYNRYRDYDPVTGRYIQADPIGLEGGSNPFGYAGANPVNLVDPDGRNALALGLGGVGEGGAGAAALAFCAEPVGWVVCGGVALGGLAYGDYLIYKHYNPDCPDTPVLEMAKGGNQNKDNEWSRAARQEQPNDPCRWLERAYNDPSTTAADRQKIKTAQKFLGCRRRG